MAAIFFSFQYDDWVIVISIKIEVRMKKRYQNGTLWQNCLVTDAALGGKIL